MEGLRPGRCGGSADAETGRPKGAPKPSGFHLRVAALGSGVVRGSVVALGDVPAGVTFSAQAEESSGLDLLQEMQMKVIRRLVERVKELLDRESAAYEDIHTKIVKTKKSIKRSFKSTVQLSKLVEICEIDKPLCDSLKGLNERIHKMEVVCIEGRRRIAIAEQSIDDIKSNYETRMNPDYFAAKKLILEGIEDDFAEANRPCCTLEGWAESKQKFSDIIKHYGSLQKVESSIMVLEKASAFKAAGKCKGFCAKFRLYIGKGRRAEMFGAFELKVAVVVNPLQHLFNIKEGK